MERKENPFTRSVAIAIIISRVVYPHALAAHFDDIIATVFFIGITWDVLNWKTTCKPPFPSARSDPTDASRFKYSNIIRGWGAEWKMETYKSFDRSIGQYPPQPATNEPVMPENNLEERNKNFSGRENELNEVRTAFENSGAVCVRQSIAGLGGVGKTQLALEYAHRFGHNYTDAIWWVNAERTPKDDLLEFALKFDLIPEGAEAAKQLTDEDIIGLLNNWCGRHGSFLFIFDNVEKAENIEPYISNIKTGHVFVTTRDIKLEIRKIINVELDVFTIEDARAFMHKRFPSVTIENEKTLDRLIEDLGRLPLALEQASAYMAETDINCEGYLALLESHGLKIFEIEAAKPENYDNIVTTTWSISLDKLSKPARQLFYLCSYMAPDNIPLEFFIQGKDILPQPLYNEISNALAVDIMIHNLTKYALVKRSGNFINIHRLVQMVARKNLTADTRWLACCLNLAYAVFGFEWGNQQSMEAFQLNVTHVLEIARQAEFTFEADGEKQEKIAWIYNEAGFGLANIGDYAKALECYCIAVKIKEKVLGTEHPDTAYTYNNIAGVYQDQGDYTKALEWYDKAVVIIEKEFGTEHPDTATTYNNIASVYQYQGDLARALEWYDKAVVISEKVLGTDHPDTAATYNNIASVYDGQGDYAKALEWYDKAVVINEKVLGTDHPSTAITYNNIAEVYKNQGEYVKALEWYDKAVVIYENVLGTEHPDTATTYNNIAGVYQYQDDYAKALGWYDKALIIREKVLGTEHPDTAATYSNIAGIYSNQGDFTKALEWFIKSYRIVNEKLGCNHPNTNKIRSSMEYAYTKTGYRGTFDAFMSELSKNGGSLSPPAPP